MPKTNLSPAITYLAIPPSGQGPGVLVVHAWWGLNDFFRGLCDRLAGEGFVAAAPDLYEGRVATTPEEAKRLRGLPKREPTNQTLLRAIVELRANPAVVGPNIGVIGFSMGGHWALWLAQQPGLPLGATVTYYGARAGDYGNSQAPCLGHFAETDEWVSPASLKKLRKSLEAAGRVADFHTYPGTGHWFAETDRTDVYDSQAAELAWSRTVAFLRRQLRPPEL
ncbi:Dienelactone hydrolase [Candidatus Promineifilum breve]|uniref:Dienelactone hydrolase n=1 Tax=Candidatus Promineifilum breve TaxID=1806508 RepID=A0A170PFQ7_9CHLR|nr:dienelactone hydrolase family protein [Candidatus Promineifilum breve]CUS03343.2 Dienelactone hydrolase [Candidatus Promineifilum breve]